MYAVIKTGGKQYRVRQGVELLVEKLPGVNEGDKVQIPEVLLFADGDKLEIGQPHVSAKVECLCVKHEKGQKLRSVKYKRRKNYRRTLGHRQNLTRLRVESIAKG